MKRFFQLMIVAIVALTACNSCSKVNDIDKRLGVLENIVSDLKAQISAGAVITSVDKTSDGCTFTLSNGQTYTVTNGKDGADGTDGEAIIADVKIEEDFVVLTLKNGETLRISYQNPLSMVTLNIVPDYDDGTVREPNTTEFNGEKSTHFYLDVAVTPAKYAEILSDTERFIHKAVFSPVLTKSGFGNAFTVSPKSVIYAEGAPVPFLEASFELDDDTAALLQSSAYTVSYSIEDKDGVHGAATAFAAISNGNGSGQGTPSDNLRLRTSCDDWGDLNADVVREARQLDLGQIRIVAVDADSKFDLTAYTTNRGNTYNFLILDGSFSFRYRSDDDSTYKYAYKYELECSALDNYDSSNFDYYFFGGLMSAWYDGDMIKIESYDDRHEIKNIKATVFHIQLSTSYGGMIRP